MWSGVRACVCMCASVQGRTRVVWGGKASADRQRHFELRSHSLCVSVWVVSPYVCVCCVQDVFGGVMDSPAIIEELASDPLLSSCKLIAASANDGLLPRSGVRGFPHYGVLLEWNNRFGADMLALLRDNTREFVTGDRGKELGRSEIRGR